MPYIEPSQRRDVIFLEGEVPPGVGHMNFFISRAIHEWLMDNGVNYTNLNAMVGVLECAKSELIRQLLNPYEDVKKSQNGPVSKLDATT